jgi:hypothetical protein
MLTSAHLCLWTAASNGPIIHSPGDIRVRRATVEWYWQGKPKNSEQNLSQYHLVHHTSYMDWPGSETVERPVTNRVSYGKA